MFQRKNDGTVKMTRQRASGNPFQLGMTTDYKTLERYTSNPGKPVVPKHLKPDAPRSVCLRKTRFKTLSFVCNEDRTGFYFVEKNYIKGTGRHSLSFGSKKRAMRALDLGRVRWKKEFTLEPRV